MELFLCAIGLTYGSWIGLLVLLLRVIVDGRDPEQVTLGTGPFRTQKIAGRLEDRWSSRQRFWFRLIPKVTLKAVALLVLVGGIFSICEGYLVRSMETFENSIHRIDASIPSCPFPLPSGSDAGLTLIMLPPPPRGDVTWYGNSSNAAPP